MRFNPKDLTFTSNKTLIILTLSVAVASIGIKVSPWLSNQILAAISPANTSSQHYQLVEGSIDNEESLRVTDGYREIDIKLCGINTSGLEEPKRAESKAHLQQLAQQGNGQVILVFTDLVSTDSDGEAQQLAEVFVPIGGGEEIHLNTQMLLDGMAYLSTSEDVSSCPNGDRLAVAEDLAKQQALGVWSQSPLKEKPKLQAGS